MVYAGDKMGGPPMKSKLLLAGMLAAVAMTTMGQTGQLQYKKTPALNEDWQKPFPGFKIVGNFYYVGTYDLGCYLIDTGQGLILINTEAPTVRLYVNGQGHFKDGARLLLAELLLDVITDEMARRYVDRSTRQGEPEAYHQVKQDLIRRYGVEIHSILLGE
jgi:hypothetical protein